MTPEHLMQKQIKCLLDHTEVYYKKQNCYIYSPSERNSLSQYLNALYKVWLQQGEDFQVTSSTIEKIINKNICTQMAIRNTLVPVFIRIKCFRTKTGARHYTKIIVLTDEGKELLREIHRRKTNPELKIEPEPIPDNEDSDD
jgi:hypothetical protein